MLLRQGLARAHALRFRASAVVSISSSIIITVLREKESGFEGVCFSSKEVGKLFREGRVVVFFPQLSRSRRPLCLPFSFLLLHLFLV